MDNTKINYYEVEFTDGYSICIKGKRKPSIKEANIFCKSDCEKMNTKISKVLPIDSHDAHKFFDMDNEANFPVFQ